MAAPDSDRFAPGKNTLGTCGALDGTYRGNLVYSRRCPLFYRELMTDQWAELLEHESYTDVAGTRTHYFDVAGGKPVFFIHGGGLTSSAEQSWGERQSSSP
jgi:hypothetical protein